MAKKVAKQAPHLRVRIDPKLIARLEKATEANGSTLTGEIVARLAELFDAADRTKLLREATEERLQELSASRDALAAEVAELRKQFLDARVENAKMEQKLKDWEERSSFARTMVDALPEHVPAMLRVTAMMMVGDPRSGEAARNMFAAMAAGKGTLTGTVSAILPAGNLSSNTTVLTGISEHASTDDVTVGSREGEKNEGPRSRAR